MYTTNTRNQTGRLDWQRTTSWRTGVRPRIPRRELTDNPPVRGKGENLGAFLARRNRWYGMLSENMESSGLYRGHSLVTDGGHSFETLSIRGYGSVRYLRRVSGKVTEQGTYPVFCNNLRPIDSGMSAFASWPSGDQGIKKYITVSGSPYLSSELRSDINGMFNSMIPDASFSGWGETIVELARGNFPKVIPSLIKRSRQAKSLYGGSKDRSKDLGSDYLNAKFGWEPIVRDTISTIEHLIGVQSLLYSSVKRHRKTLTRHAAGSAPSSVIFDPGAPDVPRNYSVPTRHRDSASCLVSARMSAKLANARPSIAANTYFDRGQDLIRRLLNTDTLAWDLLPWSWLIDWSGHIGQSIENVAAYGKRWTPLYAWATVEGDSIGSVRSFSAGSGAATSANFEFSNIYTSAHYQRRQPVSPFGPQFTLPNLSLSQWSILTALGFSRLK